MRLPKMQFRLWMAMVAVAISAGILAEFGQRRERLARLGIAHRERADACFDRTGRICKLGETPTSIEAFYRRQGPTVWSDYQKGLFTCLLPASTTRPLSNGAASASRSSATRWSPERLGLGGVGVGGRI